MNTVQMGAHYDPKFTRATDTPQTQTKVAEVEREEDSTQTTSNNIRGSQPLLQYRTRDIQKIKGIEILRLMEQISTERKDKE